MVSTPVEDAQLAAVVPRRLHDPADLLHRGTDGLLCQDVMTRLQRLDADVGTPVGSGAGHGQMRTAGQD